MVIAFVGDAPDAWPVKTEQHETYQRINQYAFGRYLISLPEGFSTGGIDSSFGASSRLTVREVKWPEAPTPEEQRESLWQAHVKETERWKTLETARNREPFYETQQVTINGFTAHMSVYYNHNKPTYKIYSEHQTAVSIHYLVDYGSYGAWFYTKGKMSEKIDIDKTLVELIQQYEPYSNIGQATVTPNAYHMLRGVINRPLTRYEKMGTSFGMDYQDGRFSVGFGTSITRKVPGLERYKALPSTAADLNVQVKKLRERKREAMACKGYESVVKLKDIEKSSMNFNWWCNQADYEGSYLFVNLSAIVDSTPKYQADHLTRWDFIVSHFQKIDAKE